MDNLFNKMCRLCACEKPKVSVNMFSAVGKRHQLPDKIRLCLPISIDEDDDLPKEICTSCLYKLEMCNELYHVSFTAQNILKSKFDNIMYEKSLEKNGNRIDGTGHISEDLRSNKSSQHYVCRQNTINIHQDSNFNEKEKNNLFEQQNSPVISQDVIVRLTSGESHSMSRPSMANIVELDKSMEQEPEMPMPGRIIVTDITGAPLAKFKNNDGLFASSSSDSDVEMEEANPSNRLSESRDKGGGKAVYDSSTDSEVETKMLSIESSSQNTKSKQPAKKRKSSSGGNVKCSFCSKWFSQDIIDHHQRLHLKERVYSCVDCGKNFSSETSLADHFCGQL